MDFPLFWTRYLSSECLGNFFLEKQNYVCTVDICGGSSTLKASIPPVVSGGILLQKELLSAWRVASEFQQEYDPVPSLLKYPDSLEDETCGAISELPCPRFRCLVFPIKGNLFSLRRVGTSLQIFLRIDLLCLLNRPPTGRYPSKRDIGNFRFLFQ